MAKAAGNTPSPKARAQVLHTLGFGVPATSDPHHFKITIPKASTGKARAGSLPFSTLRTPL